MSLQIGHWIAFDLDYTVMVTAMGIGSLWQLANAMWRMYAEHG